jgi:hypothetical protein
MTGWDSSYNFIADGFYITSSLYMQLQTSAASNLAGAGGRRGFALIR